MTSLFQRDWLVRVAGTQIAGLDVQFTIVKTRKRQPNTLSLTIFGLSRDQRGWLESLSVSRGAGQIRVELESGYAGSRSLLFRGDLQRAISTREGAEVSTVLEGADGGRSVLDSRIQKSYPAGTRVSAVVKDCARAMGLGLGNLETLAAAARTRGGETFAQGTILTGNASEELTGILRSCGLTWSVQNGVLQVLRAGQALSATAVRLSPETGLIGEAQADPDGTIQARALLIPDLIPGGRVVLSTDARRGTYTVDQVTYSGDTAGNDWFADLVLVP
jgi:hypothetical protein